MLFDHQQLGECQLLCFGYGKVLITFHWRCGTWCRGTSWNSFSTGPSNTGGEGDLCGTTSEDLWRSLAWLRSLAVFLGGKTKTWFPDFQENIWRYQWIETPHVPSVVALGNWLVSKTLISPESTLLYNSRCCCCDMPWLGICLGSKWGNSRKNNLFEFCRICIQLYGIILIVG